MLFKPKNTALIILALILMAFAACIESYDDGNQREPGILVITGAVNSGPGPYLLKISTTSVYTRITEPVCCAQAVLYDSEGASEPFYEFANGEYQCAGSMLQPAPGKAYYVEVELESGARYRSEPDTMPEVSGAVQLTSRLDTPARRLDFFTNAQITASKTPPLLRWDIRDSYLFEPTDFPDPFNSIPPPCYIDAPLFEQKKVLFNGEENPLREIEEVYLASREVEHTFKQLHYIKLDLLGMSRRANTFWEQVNQATSQNGSATDPPPAPVRGNIANINNPEEEVLGFFEATTLIDTSLLRFYPGYFPWRFNSYCEFMQNRPYPGQYPEDCQNCLGLPYSSLRRPDWWP